MPIHRSASSVSMAKSTRPCPPQSSPNSSSSKPITPRNQSTSTSTPPVAQLQQVHPQCYIKYQAHSTDLANILPFPKPRPRNLRHNDLHRLPRKHNLRRPSCLNGLPPPLRRPTGKTILSPPQLDHDPPTLRRLLRSSNRYRDPREGNPACARATQSDLSAPFDE